MTPKNGNPQSKAPPLRMRFTQELVDKLTYKEVLRKLPRTAAPAPGAAPPENGNVPATGGGATPPDTPSSTPSVTQPDAPADTPPGGAAKTAADPSDDASAARAAPPAEPTSVRVWDALNPGFGLRLFSNGKRQYFVAGRVRRAGSPGADGKRGDTQRYITLKPPSDAFSLKDARSAAAHKLLDLREGKDCSARGRKAEAAAQAELDEQQQAVNRAFEITLAEVYGVFRESNSPGSRKKRRPATLHFYDYIVGHYLYAMTDKPVATITKETCRVLFLALSNGTFVPPPLQPGAQARTKRLGTEPEVHGGPTTANAVMRVLRSLLTYARRMLEDSQGNCPILGINPVVAMHRLDPPNPARPREGRIPRERLRAVWHGLEAVRVRARHAVSRTAASLEEFRLLSGMRPRESACLTWREVDFAREWVELPGQRTKNHRAHKMPMNAPMHKVLMDRRAVYLAAHPECTEPPPDHWVFESTRSKSGHVENSTGTQKLVKALAGVHVMEQDLRRTFIDLATEARVDFPERQRLLNHKGGVLQTHYANSYDALVDPMRRIGAYFEAFEAAAPDDKDAPTIEARLGWPKNKPRLSETHLEAWLSLSVADLVSLVWEKPCAQIARDFGLNANTVRQRCKRLGIPVPGRGYWRKVAVGLIDKKPPPVLPQQRAMDPGRLTPPSPPSPPSPSSSSSSSSSSSPSLPSESLAGPA